MTAPYHPVLSDEQRANLRKLAAYLLSLPADYTESDMSEYSDAYRPARQKCGTVACACGHGPYAGIAPSGFELWGQYSYRAFGLKEYSDAWGWCFSGEWERVDNTPHGAAARINYMLEHGVPDDGYEQAEGDAPLSYAVPA